MPEKVESVDTSISCKRPEPWFAQFNVVVNAISELPFDGKRATDGEVGFEATIKYPMADLDPD